MAIQKTAGRDKPSKTTSPAAAAKKGGGAKPMGRQAPGKPGAALSSDRKARPPTAFQKPTTASPAARKPEVARPAQAPGTQSAAPHRAPVKPAAKPRPVPALSKKPTPPHRTPVKVPAKPVPSPALRVPERKRPHGGVKFSKKDLDGFRDQLFALYEDLAGQIGKMRKNALRRDDEVNVEEDGSDAFDRLFALERAGTEQETINQITNALRAIREGAYGVCDACGGLVEKARLQALPFVKNCMVCQSEMERHKTRGGAVPRRMIP